MVDDIEAWVIEVKFTYDRSEPIYVLEWFSHGETKSGEFFGFQLRDDPARPATQGQ